MSFDISKGIGISSGYGSDFAAQNLTPLATPAVADIQQFNAAMGKSSEFAINSNQAGSTPFSSSFGSNLSTADQVNQMNQANSVGQAQGSGGSANAANTDQSLQSLLSSLMSLLSQIISQMQADKNSSSAGDNSGAAGNTGNIGSKTKAGVGEGAKSTGSSTTNSAANQANAKGSCDCSRSQ